MLLRQGDALMARGETCFTIFPTPFLTFKLSVHCKDYERSTFVNVVSLNKKSELGKSIGHFRVEQHTLQLKSIK